VKLRAVRGRIGRGARGRPDRGEFDRTHGVIRPMSGGVFPSHQEENARMSARSGPSKVGQAGKGSRASGPDSRGRPNSLGLSQTELEAVHAQLDGGAPAETAHRRQSARLAYRQDGILLDIVQPGGGQTTICVACRNLSRTGLGFLHSSYLHTGTRVVARLMHHSKRLVPMEARVVRCRHVTRHVHEVGLMFDEPINVRDFMSPDPLNQTFTCEKVDPGHLTGTMLIIAEYKIEQACVQSMLRDTALDFVFATSIEEGVEAARRGVEIIVCDDTFEAGTGVDFVARARAAGVRSPIILMSGDVSEQSLSRIRKAQVNAFLAKPLKQDLLLRAIAEFLLVTVAGAESSGPLYTTLPARSAMLGLADSFVDDLHSIAEQVEELATRRDAKGIRKHCLRVGGPAASLGFEPIAGLATRLAAALETDAAFDDSAMALNAFISGCKSVRKGVRPEAPAGAAPSASQPSAGGGADKHAKAEDKHEAHPPAKAA
jgi:CheY-like chemotaxis protein/HPt (histidine-containing phosphotransfer) domain-containing protein